MSPYHEVTRDNFGFLVGAHLTDRLAVIRVLIDQNCRFWAKNAVFSRLEILFLETYSKKNTILTGHGEDNVFGLTPLHSGLLGGHQSPIFCVKIGLFYDTRI